MKQINSNFKKSKTLDKIIKSLTGIIKDEGKTLDDYRNERLTKYEKKK